MIHAVTTYAMSDKVDAESLFKPLQEFRNEIHQLFKELQYNPSLKDERGVLNEREFVAELTNPIFRQKIQAIDNGRRQSFWQRIVDAVKNLLGIHSSSPYYTRMMNTLDKAINAFDVKTYMEYNGLTKSIKSKQFNTDYNVINNKEQQYGEDKWQKGLLAGGQILRDALREELGTKQNRHGENERETNQSSNLRERVHEESTKQQKALINWAKKNNYLIVEPLDYFNEIFGDSNLHGTESTVWKDSANNRVIKAIALNHYATPQKLLERILVHNSVFPNTAIKLEGIGTSSKGINIIVSQPFIKDSNTISSYEEIENYMTKTLGFQHNKGIGPKAEYTKDDYLVSDIRPENVLKQSDGSLAVIDCFAMITKQSENNSQIDYNTLSTNDIKREIHDYVDNLPENAVKSKEALHSFINSLTGEYEKYINDIYSEIEQSRKQNREDTNLVVNKIRQIAREKISKSSTIPTQPTIPTNPIASMPSITSIDSITPQLIEHLKSIGIDVNDRAAIEEYLKENGYNNIEEAVNDFLSPIPYGPDHPYHNDQKATEEERKKILSIIENNKYNKPGTDLVILENGKNSAVYVVDYPSFKVLKENQEKDRKNNVKADGFGIRKAYKINDLTKKDVKEIIRDLGYKYRNSEGSLINRLQRLGVKREYLYSPDIVTFIKAVTSSNGGLVIRRRGQWEETNKRRNNRNGSKNKGLRNKAKGEFFLTPSGEIYGFVTPDGRMFLDETKINPEHPIHEYTHLWDRALMRTNIRLWNRGVELMKQTSLWKAIEEDANYGAKWKAQGLSQTELDNLIASEVHARFVGEGGAKLLEQLAKEKGQEGIIAKLKDWILDVWKSLTATFSDWSEDEINKLTLKDFNHMTMRDFAEGINPNTINPVQKVLSDKKIDMQKTLSLPNFEHFVYNRAAKDLKGIEIDYPWKGQYLKDLDSQFRRMDSEDDEIYMSDDDKQFNQKLIDKMKVILNAKDKDDYLDKEQREKKEDIQSALSDYDRLNQQYANLLNGMTEEDGLKYVDSPLKVSEIRHIAELSMDYISDTISDIQAEKGLAEKLFPNVKPEEGFDFTKAERVDIINTIGIENLLGYAKDKFNTEKNDWFDEVENFNDASLKADFIMNNWEAIVKIGSDIFAFNEGIGIARNYGDHKFKTTKENLQLDPDNFNGNTDEDSLNETEGDAQEHWQVDFRTVDAINSMSALVRQAIHECYKLDESGEPVMNPLFGIKERVDPRQVTNSILRWTQGALTLDDMIEKLREKQKDNTWLNQLIKRLEDKSGNNTDFQSQFFSVFCKHFQLYSIVIDQEGKFTCINANAHPALTEVMDSIKAKYRIDEHPMFSTNGKINKELLGKDEDSYKKDDHAFNLYQAMAHLPQWNFRGMHIDVDMSEDKVAEYSEWLSKVAKALGFDATPDMIASVLTKDTLSTMVEKLHFIAHDLSSAIEAFEDKGKSYDPFKYKGGHDIGTAVQNFMAPIASILEDITINAFYDSGKMYQSYVTPSFTTKLFKKLTNLTNEKFDKFMEEEYGKSEWFGHKVWEQQFGKEVMHWNVPWLESMRGFRDILDHRVQLNFNGHNYMRNLTDPEYALSVISEYFSEEQIRGKDVGWFRIPMESNKPSEEFIRFVAYKDQSHYKNSIVDDLYDMALMEISRIQTVIMRNKSKGEEGFIKNFDTNGRQFNFFPFLNDYIEKGKQGTILKDADGNISDDNKVLADLLQRKISGLEENKLTTEEELQMAKLIKKVTKTYMQDRVNNMLDMFDRKGITEAAQKIKNIIDPEYLDTKDDNGKELEGEALDKHNEFVNRKMKEALENFLWNDYLASKNILMMMVGDTAFYKDAEDLQKRLAELHAPGVRGNINATDYDGVKVSSDGKYRTIILKDFDSFKSNIIANLTEVFDRKIAQAKESEKAGFRALKEDILDAYSKINVADAEGYSCMTSYRKKALMFGRWSKASEEIYKRILKSNYTYTDLKTAFQPMKPFVYTHLQKNMGVDKAPISMMYCPFQAKNSEVLLVMADALLRNENTSRPNILRAISNIMEDSTYDGRVRNALGEVTTTGTYNGKGIDTVQFESAIK